MAALIKCFTTIGALFMLLFGVAILAGTAYLWSHDDVFLGNSDIKNTFLWVALIVGIIVVAGASDGIYGICRVKPCHLCIFQIFIIICLVLFTALAVVCAFTPGIVFEGTCTQSKNPVIGEANNIYKKSAEMFCQRECPCALDNTTDAFQQRYNDIEKAEIAGYNIDMNGNKTTADCIRSNITDAEASLLSVIGSIELTLECSLWCPTDITVSNLIYRFGDINSGRPAEFCYDKLKELFDDVQRSAKYTLLVGSGVTLLMFICNLYLCCCAKDRRGKKLRQRFLYYDARQDDTFERYDRLDRRGK